jgi:hypothetical protein
MVLEVAEADLERQADFVNVKGAPAVPQIARRRERSAFVSWTPKMRQLAKVEPCP